MREHSARVYRLAYRLTGNKHDAEDLTQETFIRVFRSLHYTPGTFEGWLHRITTNLFLDQARRKQRIRMDAMGDDDDRYAAPATSAARARLRARQPRPRRPAGARRAAARVPRRRRALRHRGPVLRGDRRDARHQARHRALPDPPGPRPAARALEHRAPRAVARARRGRRRLAADGARMSHLGSPDQRAGRRPALARRRPSAPSPTSPCAASAPPSWRPPARPAARSPSADDVRRPPTSPRACCRSAAPPRRRPARRRDPFAPPGRRQPRDELASSASPAAASALGPAATAGSLRGDVGAPPLARAARRRLAWRGSAWWPRCCSCSASVPRRAHRHPARCRPRRLLGAGDRSPTNAAAGAPCDAAAPSTAAVGRRRRTTTALAGSRTHGWAVPAELPDGWVVTVGALVRRRRPRARDRPARAADGDASWSASSRAPRHDRAGRRADQRGRRARGVRARRRAVARRLAGRRHGRRGRRLASDGADRRARGSLSRRRLRRRGPARHHARLGHRDRSARTAHDDAPTTRRSRPGPGGETPRTGPTSPFAPPSGRRAAARRPPTAPRRSPAPSAAPSPQAAPTASPRSRDRPERSARPGRLVRAARLARRASPVAPPTPHGTPRRTPGPDRRAGVPVRDDAADAGAPTRAGGVPHAVGRAAAPSRARSRGSCRCCCSPSSPARSAGSSARRLGDDGRLADAGLPGRRRGADTVERPPESVAGIAAGVLPSVVSIEVRGPEGSATGSGFVLAATATS